MEPRSNHDMPRLMVFQSSSQKNQENDKSLLIKLSTVHRCKCSHNTKLLDEGRGELRGIFGAVSFYSHQMNYLISRLLIRIQENLESNIPS